jgi:hypothetical protein
MSCGLPARHHGRDSASDCHHEHFNPNSAESGRTDRILCIAFIMMVISAGVHNDVSIQRQGMDFKTVLPDNHGFVHGDSMNRCLED